MVSLPSWVIAILFVVSLGRPATAGAYGQEVEDEGPPPTHALILANGTRVPGNLVSVEKGRVVFHSEDGRDLSHDASEITAVIAAGGGIAAAKEAPETGGIRFARAVAPGPILRYRAGSPYVIHVQKGRPRVTVVETHDPIVLLHPGPAGDLADLELDEKFARSALKAMGVLGRSDPPSAVRLGHDVVELSGPSGGRMAARVKEAIAKLRVAWERKAPGLFTIPAATIYHDEDRLFFTYEIRSKMDSFDGLECRIWARLGDGTVHASRFIYYTARRGKSHTDLVEPDRRGVQVTHWRIQLFAHGVAVAARESEPPGPEGWWNDKSARAFTSWGIYGREPNRYCSFSLGKRGVDHVPRDSLTLATGK